MSIIRWDNIALPDFRDSMLGFAQAGKNFDNATTGIKQLATDQRTIGDANWDNQAKINTDDLIANLKGRMGTIGDFNNNEQLFDAATNRGQLGTQYDQSAIDALKSTLQGKLRSDAVDQAMLTGQNVANKSGSTVSAAEAFSNSLREAGAKESFNQDQSANFLQNGLALYKQKEDAARTLLNNQLIGQMQGMSAKEQDAFVAEQNKLYGTKINVKELYDVARGEKAERYADVSRGQQAQSFANSQTLFKQNQGDRNRELLYEKVLGEAQAIAATGDEGAARAHLMSLPGSASDKANLALSNRINLLTQQTPEEQMKFAAENQAIQNEGTAALAEGNAYLANLDHQITQNEYMPAGRFEKINMEGNIGSILGKIKDTTDDEGFLGNKGWWSAAVLDTGAREFFTKEADALVKQGFSVADANRIVLGAADAHGGTTETWRGAASYSAPEMKQRIVENAQRQNALNMLSQHKLESETAIAKDKLKVAELTTNDAVNLMESFNQAKLNNQKFNFKTWGAKNNVDTSQVAELKKYVAAREKQLKTKPNAPPPPLDTVPAHGEDMTSIQAILDGIAKANNAVNGIAKTNRIR